MDNSRSISTAWQRHLRLQTLTTAIDTTLKFGTAISGFEASFHMVAGRSRSAGTCTHLGQPMLAGGCMKNGGLEARLAVQSGAIPPASQK